MEALKVWGGGIAGTFEKAGRMSCTVVNCINHANVTAADFSGGITGYAIEFGTSVSAGVKLSEKNRENGQSDSVGSIPAVSITSCINKGTVMSAEKESSMGTGGILGYLTAGIEKTIVEYSLFCKDLSGKATAARRYMPDLFEFEWWTVAEKQGLFGSPKRKDYKWV